MCLAIANTTIRMKKVAIVTVVGPLYTMSRDPSSANSNIPADAQQPTVSSLGNKIRYFVAVHQLRSRATYQCLCRHEKVALVI